MAGLDNQSKIIALLGIDIVFFFIEIISGYAVGSLALVADSFHMLNDIMSLVVALYAVRLVQKVVKARNIRTDGSVRKFLVLYSTECS